MQHTAYFLIMFAILTSNLRAQDILAPDETIVLGHTYSWHSSILNEKQTYSVYLPPSYSEKNKSKAYPVVFVLDGYSTQFRGVSAALETNNVLGSKVPEAIVIGLPSNNRNRDYLPQHSTTGYKGTYEKRFEVSGGGIAYRRYLREELFPMIEEQYRTNGHRILIGHSFGGHFALFDLLSDDRLFQSYIAIDPIVWFGDWYMGEMAKAVTDGFLRTAGSLYISKVPHDDKPKRSATVISVAAEIEQKSSAKFRVIVKDFEDENHQSVQPISYHEGLRFVFAGYEPPSIEAAARDPNLLTAHYEKFSARIGISYLPDEAYVNAVAFNALGFYKLTENAHALYQMNIENYPTSSNAWANLGYYYEAIADMNRALNAYSRAIELNPDASYAKRRLNALSQ